VLGSGFWFSDPIHGSILDEGPVFINAKIDPSMPRREPRRNPHFTLTPAISGVRLTPKETI